MERMNFEKALTELEATVEKLESGSLSLDDSLGLFEQGVKLAKYLRKELDKAEKKIEILLKDEEGQIKAEPFAPDAAADEEEAGGDESGGDGEIPF